MDEREQTGCREHGTEYSKDDKEQYRRQGKLK